MEDLLGGVPIPRRTMVLFFVVDTSGSMYGKKMGVLNETIRDVIPIIGDISQDNADAEIKIAVLDFSSGARWIYDRPVSAESFSWQDLNAEGLTDFGEACTQLREKMSRNEFLNEIKGSYAPVIILLSDGAPTDNYQPALTALRENNWFKTAIKVAIAIGEDANKDVLEEFTGNVEAVIEVHNKEALKKIIRFVTVTSSQIGSKSSQIGTASKQEEVIEKIGQFVEQENIEAGDDEFE